MVRSQTLPPRSTLSDALTNGILTLMRDKELKQGDRLPSVRELSDHFQVAVPTLREAIRRLEAFGVIEVKHGAGIFIRTPQPPLLLANPTATAIDRRVILDLIDTRILFEPYCAAQAASNPESTEVAALATILEQAGAALENDDAMLQSANMAFHRGIALCAGNTVLAQVMSLLTEIYASEQSVMLIVSNERARDHREHVAVLDAIQAGDADRASELMRAHLHSVRETVQARLPAPPQAPAPPSRHASTFDDTTPAAHAAATTEEVPAADR